MSILLNTSNNGLSARIAGFSHGLDFNTIGFCFVPQIYERFSFFYFMFISLYFSLLWIVLMIH